MLQEYICLGGNEVVNNARTYGYASTADCPLGWFRCEPCGSLHDAVNDWIPAEYRWIELARNFATNPSFEATSGTVEVWRNLATNPSFETTSGTVEVRRNLALDPRATALTWMGNEAGNSAVVNDTTQRGSLPHSTSIKVTATDVGNSSLLSAAGGVTPAAPGDIIYGSAWVHNEGPGTANFSVWIRAYDASNVETGQVQATAVTLAAGETRRLSAGPLTCAANTTQARLNVRRSFGTAAAIWYTTGFLIEKSATLNPYFDGASRPRIRENLVINPNFETSVGSWVAEANVTIARSTAKARTGSASMLVTKTTLTPTQAGMSISVTGLTVGATYTLSAYFTQGTGDAKPYVLVPGIGNTTPLTLDSTWQRSTYTFVATANTHNVAIQSGNATVASSTFYVDDVMVEQASTAGTYFDGATDPSDDTTLDVAWTGTANASTSYVYDPDLTASWTGTANASASVVTGANVTSYGSHPSNGDKVFSSARYASTGTKSVRLAISGGSSTDTFISFPHQWFGTITPGRTFTLLAKVHLKAPMTGSAGSLARAFTVNWVGTTASNSPALFPNTAGTHAVSWTFTIPTGATGANFSRLYSGHQGGEMWVDDFVIVEGVYTGPYFDGGRRPRLRENILTVPIATGSWGEGYGSPGGAGTAAVVDDARFKSGKANEMTWTAGVTTDNAVYVAAAVTTPVTPGASYVFQYRSAMTGWSRTPDFYAPGGTLGPRTRIDNGDGTITTWAVWTAGTITTLGFTVSVSGPGEYPVAGSIWRVGDFAVEPGTTFNPYFDGTTPPDDGSGLATAWTGTANASSSYVYDPDLTAAWAGTANASASTLTAARVTSLNGPQTMKPFYSSARFVATGARSLTTMRQTSDVGQGDFDLFSFPLVAGDVRTFKVTAHVKKTFTGQVFIGVRTNGGSSPQERVEVPNAVGTHDLSLTFTASAGTTSGVLRVWMFNGVAGDQVWWDNLMILPGTYDGDYFDGDTPDADGIFYSWKGTANASESVMEEYQVVREGYSAEPPYEWGNISRAPWYDEQRADLTSRFYGPWVIDVTGVDDSTRSASVTESILDGGVVGLVRHASREIRVRALLTAEGKDALEYGLSWLDANLEADSCSSHGSACGAVDAMFFSSCPDPDLPDDIEQEALGLSRYLHNVTVVSGPLITDYMESRNKRHVAYIVEWTMVAGTPFVFGPTTEVPLEPSLPTVIQDVPYNLVPVPSAELVSGSTVTVATNYVTNPSLEVDAAGWTAGANTITPTPTGARSTELAASGVASYKLSVTATNSGTNGTIFGWRDVTLPAGSGFRYSTTVWAAAFVVSGTAVLARTDFNIEWRDASTLLRTDVIGIGALNGGTISARSIVPPAGAITARLVIRTIITSWSTGAVLNMFIDAAAVTVP